MENGLAISVKKVSKKYNLYNTPQDRFKEVFNPFRKKYSREFYALRDISFDVKKGETVGIIGTNGSGKSTILKIITDVLEPSDGIVEVNGNISALLELGAGFNMEYTGRQNIYLNGKIMGRTKNEMDDCLQAILDFAEIGEFIDQPVKNYSSGMFARLAFAVAINVNPDILIVDEALSVGDMFFQNKCFKKFDELREKGITILFVSHDISSVRQMCSRVVWIEKGQQVIFDKSNIVCDMYMDMKRQNMNELVEDVNDNIPLIKSIQVDDKVRKYPAMRPYETQLSSDELEVVACFFTDENGKTVSHLVTGKRYASHIALKFNKDKKHIIAGFILENQKGIPLFDINNYINQQETINGRAGFVEEAIYEFELPRLMKGTYILSTGISEGTQEKNVCLTWLHGVGAIEIINEGYNSSYIEIPANIHVDELSADAFEII